MIIKFPKIETDISVFDKARRKFDACEQSREFSNNGVCVLFHKTMNSSSDFLAQCGSCSFNTKEPTTHKK